MHWKTTAIIVALLSAPVLARPNLIGTDWQLVSPKVADPQPTLSFQARALAALPAVTALPAIAMPKANW